MGNLGFEMASLFLCSAAILLVVCVVHPAQSDPYLDVSVAKPDMSAFSINGVPGAVNMMQLGQGATVTQAGANDVTVAGVLYAGGNLHSAANVISERSINAAQDIHAQNNVIAEGKIESLGEISAGKRITALADIMATGNIVTEGSLTTNGVLTVQLATNAAELINAQKGILANGIVRSTENIVSDKRIVASSQRAQSILSSGSLRRMISTPIRLSQPKRH